MKTMDKTCLWCGSETAKTTKGWIPFRAHNKTVPDIFHFCSKKCQAAATYKGKGTTLDLNKLAEKHRRNNQKKKSTKINKIMQKGKLSNEDLTQLFLCLTAKQKKVLSLIGLAQTSWLVERNPVELLKKNRRSCKGVVSMKKIILLILLSVLLVSCNRLDSGIVVSKEFVHKHSQPYVYYIYTGKVMIPVSGIRTVPNSWYITIEGEVKNKIKTRTISVSEVEYDSIRIGDFIDVKKGGLKWESHHCS